jgi:hypothetical protein
MLVLSPASFAEGSGVRFFMTRAWSWVALFTFTACVNAETLPAGTRVSIRVQEAISSAQAKVGDPVNAQVTAAVPSDEHPALSAGLLVSGSVRRVFQSQKGQPARMQIVFDQMRRSEGGPATTIAAKIADVDNAREVIEADGTICGLKPLRMQPSKKEYLLMAVAYAHPLILASFESERLLRMEMDKPTIRYVPGADMTLELTAPLDVKALTGPVGLNAGTLVSEREFTQLVARQPLRTHADGTVSDQTNFLFIGTAEQMDAAFTTAGWKLAAGRGFHSDLRTVAALFERTGYAAEPVSTLTLGGLPPDRVYEKQTNTISKRHHIRIWLQKERLSGAPVWIAAATHDIGVAFSRAARGLTHRVESNVDIERAKVLDDLRFSGLVDRFAFVARSSATREFRNATGDSLVSDGRMAVIVFRSQAATPQ